MQRGLINYKSTCKEFLPSFCWFELVLLSGDFLEAFHVLFYGYNRPEDMLV